MKKTLKAIALFLALTFVLLCAAGCGNKETAAQDESETAAESETVSASEDVSATEAGSVAEAASEKQVAKDERATVKEQVLVDDPKVRITLKSIEYDHPDPVNGGAFPVYRLFAENKGEKMITIDGGLIVNGVDFGPICDMSCTTWRVEAGKSGESLGRLDGLERAGITTIKDIELKFYIYEIVAEDYSDELCLETDYIHVSTSADPSYVQKYNDKGDEIYNNDGIRIVVQDDYMESGAAKGKYIFIENLSDKDIYAALNNYFVNGKPSEGGGLGPVHAGTRAFSWIVGCAEEGEKTNSMGFRYIVCDCETDEELGYTTEYTATF